MKTILCLLLIIVAVIILLPLTLIGCGFDSLYEKVNGSAQAWSEIKDK